MCEPGVDVFVGLLYAAVCLLPLAWLLGCLPPLDALLPWATEQALTHIMGGSHMATDLRSIIARDRELPPCMDISAWLCLLLTDTQT